MAIIRPTSTFDKILLQGIRAGNIPARSQEARDWFRAKAKQETTITDAKFIREESDRLKDQTAIGSMFFFMYDPKTKATLEHYDRFPLIFPIERYKDGFLGINLHYLPYKQRAMLMDALYTISTDNRYDNKTKLTISYQILKNASKFKWFLPCVKRYLTSHVRSRFIAVHPTEWDIALFLPLAIFEKQSQTEVWKAALAKVR